MISQAKFSISGVFSGILAALCLLALAGCSTPDKLDFRTCPQVLILGDAAKATRLARANSKDVADTLYQVRLANIQGGCKYYDDSVDLEFTVNLVAQAGAAFDPARHYQEEYFVAILDAAGNRLAKKNFVTDLVFEEGATNAVQTETLTPSIPLAKDADAAGYTVYVGLQLAPDDLAKNRAEQPGS